MWQKVKDHLAVIGAVLLLVVVVLAKYSSFMISLLTAKSKAEVDSATKQDAALKAQEQSDNAKADALVKEVAALPSLENPVPEDWDKK